MLCHRVWLLLALIALQGCAARSPDPCRSNDWYAIGYQDGLSGRAFAATDSAAHACPGGITESELAHYSNGREAGLGQYCEPQNGFRLGSQGHSYQGACGDQASDFLSAYQTGTQIHQLEAQIARLEAILSVNESERQSLAERIARKQLQLERGAGDALLHAELQELRETMSVVKDEIDALGAALREQQSQLALLRETAALH